MMLNSDGGLIKDCPKKMKFNSGAMTSIRKIKKRLKKEIVELRATYRVIKYNSIHVLFLGTALYKAKQLRLQQLQQLKRRNEHVRRGPI